MRFEKKTHFEILPNQIGYISLPFFSDLISPLGTFASGDSQSPLICGHLVRAMQVSCHLDSYLSCWLIGCVMRGMCISPIAIVFACICGFFLKNHNEIL